MTTCQGFNPFESPGAMVHDEFFHSPKISSGLSPPYFFAPAAGHSCFTTPTSHKTSAKIKLA